MDKSKESVPENRVHNMKMEEDQSKVGGGSAKWSKDWNDFDWEIVKEKLEVAEKELAQDEGSKEKYDIGITLEEFEEYLQWFAEQSPEEYDKLILYIALKQSGVEEQQIGFLLSHPEALNGLLEIW